jgi:hypothetical protein
MFYTFTQNNSAGYFVINDRVCHFVIIEADTAEQANDKAEDIGIYFNGVRAEIDCSCCGDRWYSQRHEDDGEETPTISGGQPSEYSDSFAKVNEVYCRVYYKDGIVKEYRTGSRIEEFAQQCMESTSVDGLGGSYKQLNHVEFAEMIIRECIAIASIKEREYNALRKSAYDFEEKEIYAEAACAAEQIQNQIKQYFGVE